jgi:hypothetical protein
MGEMSRAIFGFFKLFGVHQNDEFSLRFNGPNVFTHTRTFGSVTSITRCSIAVNCLHLN